MSLGTSYVDLLKHSLVDLLNPTTQRAVRQRDGGFAIEDVPEAERERRLTGRDWPVNGSTMVGLERLTNVQQCVEAVLADDVPGDFIEAGVWRGGTTVLMRALLEVHDDVRRRVWVADSFAGLPRPQADQFPADAGDNHHTYDFLVVPVEEVKRTFARYGFLDDRVRFIVGWFRDTLPRLRDETWAIVRVDGDMYESTFQALENLYPNLSPGGYLIADDYGAIPSSAKAVEDFRRAQGITDELHQVDWTGVYWRKGEPRPPRRASLPEPARQFTRTYWENRHLTWANTLWRGVPVQKLPLDLWVLQEIIVETCPTVIVETGAKFGGSALFFADLLELGGGGSVISIEISGERLDARAHGHPGITFIENDSTNATVIERVRGLCEGRRIMVVLDSDHRAEHVLRELDGYGPLVSPGCYLVVEDTIVNGNPISRDFGPGPAEAIADWLPAHPEFEVDRSREKFMATFQPGGYLERR